MISSSSLFFGDAAGPMAADAAESAFARMPSIATGANTAGRSVSARAPAAESLSLGEASRVGDDPRPDGGAAECGGLPFVPAADGGSGAGGGAVRPGRRQAPPTCGTEEGRCPSFWQ